MLHVGKDATVMLTMNLRTVWNLANGARGHVVVSSDKKGSGAMRGRAKTQTFGTCLFLSYMYFTF